MTPVKVALSVSPFLLAAVFWAGSALSNSKATGTVASDTVREVHEIRKVVSRHDTEIAVLKTNQEYIKEGIDDIKTYMSNMDRREGMRARHGGR